MWQVYLMWWSLIVTMFPIRLKTASRALLGDVQVFGCIKNTLVVGVGVAMGDRVAPAQLAGYALSVSGFALYTRAKMLQAQGAEPKAPRRAHRKAL